MRVRAGHCLFEPCHVLRAAISSCCHVWWPAHKHTSWTAGREGNMQHPTPRASFFRLCLRESPPPPRRWLTFAVWTFFRIRI